MLLAREDTPWAFARQALDGRVRNCRIPDNPPAVNRIPGLTNREFVHLQKFFTQRALIALNAAVHFRTARIDEQVWRLGLLEIRFKRAQELGSIIRLHPPNSPGIDLTEFGPEIDRVRARLFAIG